MNKIVEFLKSRPVSFYLRLAATVLAFVPIVYMATRIEIEPKYIGAVVCAALAVAAHVALMFTENRQWSDFIEIAVAALTAAEFSLFIAGGVLDVVDYVFQINFWGEASQFGSILTYAIIIFISMGLSVASCFMNKAYEKKSV